MSLLFTLHNAAQVDSIFTKAEKLFEKHPGSESRIRDKIQKVE